MVFGLKFAMVAHFEDHFGGKVGVDIRVTDGIGRFYLSVPTLIKFRMWKLLLYTSSIQGGHRTSSTILEGMVKVHVTRIVKR